jgi:hypothetical protein
MSARTLRSELAERELSENRRVATMASPALTPPINNGTPLAASSSSTAPLPQGWSKELMRYPKETVMSDAPSRKHGFSYEEEKLRRAEMVTVIYESVRELHLSVFSSGIVAATFFHHFFMKFSLQEFDPFVSIGESFGKCLPFDV